MIFDLDGTLLDTLADISLALNEALRHHGLPGTTVDDVRSRVGWGLEHLVSQSVPPELFTDEDLVFRIAETTRIYYRSRPVVHTMPYPGVEDLLRDLHRGEVPMMVLSNKPDDLVQPIVAQLLHFRFAMIAGARPDVPRKPDPTTTVAAIEALQVRPKDVIFVGDSEIDIETARAAGCQAVAVAWGFRDATALRDAGAHQLCYSIDELRAAVGLTKKEETV